ncbi:MAG: pro-sigmaK processing inhibitor BofA family protein [Candidatus Micrarchaeota archaeon]
MLAEIILLILVILFAVVAIKMLKRFGPLILNSFVALIVLWILNAVFGLGIDVNIFSILIVAIGGLPGLLLVVLLKILGIAF